MPWGQIDARCLGHRLQETACSPPRCSWTQRCKPVASRRRRREPCSHFVAEPPDDRGKDGNLHFVVFATSNILESLPFLFLLDLQRQITENGGSRRLRQLQCFEQVKRALRMHPKPTTSQPQRAAATVSLCSKQTLISLVLQYSVDCRAPSTALLYGPKEGGNIQQEMSNTC